MLTNKAKLGVKEGSGSTYTDLPGLKEIPEMGQDPEKVENTCLTDEMMHYEKGIGDPGDMEFRFKYDNSSANTAYRKLRALEAAGSTNEYQLELADHTKYQFSAQVVTKFNGGGINTAADFTAALMLQSDIVIVDPE